MYFAFYRNFTPHDLICKVAEAEEEIRAGSGATLQFNASKTLRGPTPTLYHHGNTTVGTRMSRRRLIRDMRRLAPVSAASFDLSEWTTWPVLLGSSDDIDGLLDALFVYAYGIEQVKRNVRGDPRLPPIGEPAIRALSIRESLGSAPRRGQGYATDPESNTAIERRAMEQAIRFYERKGYSVTDTSKRECFDLLCRKGGRERRVEVKGLQGEPISVLLTRNEVESARSRSHRTDLFVLHGISVLTGRRKVKAIGGKRCAISNWRPRRDQLEVERYRYRLPSSCR
jgi:hypothetical protein